MRCLLCRNLELEFETHRDRYIEASSLACNHVTNRLAAYWNVEMERSRIDLEEHRAVCVFYASNALAHTPVQRPFTPQRSPVEESVAPAA